MICTLRRPSHLHFVTLQDRTHGSAVNAELRSNFVDGEARFVCLNDSKLIRFGEVPLSLAWLNCGFTR